jgi:GNAT superfamily N-acetyltransferase
VAHPHRSAARGSCESSDIADIALLPEYCNRGIGSALLRQLQAEARAARKPLRIHVERFNPALRLYERLGFRQIEDKGVYLFLEWTGDNSQRSNDPTIQGESVKPSG